MLWSGFFSAGQGVSLRAKTPSRGVSVEVCGGVAGRTSAPAGFDAVTRSPTARTETAQCHGYCEDRGRPGSGRWAACLTGSCRSRERTGASSRGVGAWCTDSRTCSLSVSQCPSTINMSFICSASPCQGVPTSTRRSARIITLRPVWALLAGMVRRSPAPLGTEVLHLRRCVKCIKRHVTDSVSDFGKSAESAAHFHHLRANRA
jgi:hypothetical protein